MIFFEILKKELNYWKKQRSLVLVKGRRTNLSNRFRKNRINNLNKDELRNYNYWDEEGQLTSDERKEIQNIKYPNIFNLIGNIMGRII